MLLCKQIWEALAISWLSLSKDETYERRRSCREGSLVRTLKHNTVGNFIARPTVVISQQLWWLAKDVGVEGRRQRMSFHGVRSHSDQAQEMNIKRTERLAKEINISFGQNKNKTTPTVSETFLWKAQFEFSGKFHVDR